ncbi:hypothetical protein HAX54_032161 [Datura stramonium]|uniref:Uncharacterized protein n=1 Tax=Datura stramonium TaxID=4076 RepID=A0ABS8VDW8_DATST|nr:hypothetical protein [Datura stramonium]
MAEAEACDQLQVTVVGDIQEELQEEDKVVKGPSSGSKVHHAPTKGITHKPLLFPSTKTPDPIPEDGEGLAQVAHELTFSIGSTRAANRATTKDRRGVHPTDTIMVNFPSLPI